MVPDAGMSFEMEKYMKRVNPDFSFPSARILELNPDNDTVKHLQEVMTSDPVMAKDLAQLLCCQASSWPSCPSTTPTPTPIWCASW